ncbi:MAG: hypothetical protein ACI4WW_06630 [Candidatus Coprovivens sp.]
MNDYIENNKKNFNLYVFLSTFSRGLIEVFIGTILYKNGFNLKQVILYYLLVNIISLLLTKPFITLSKKTSNRVLAIIGIISFILLQIVLNIIKPKILYLLLVSFLFATYRRGYWMSRRFYNLKTIQKKNISTSYTLISIVNQIAVVISSYIGALLLDFISIKILTIISISLFIISILPLYKLKFTHEYNNEKLDLFKTMKQIGFGNIYLFSSYELLNVIKFLFPLYIFIYVKNTYQIIGLLALIQSIATILFSYIYGRIINKDKNFLSISILLSIIVYIFKANTTGVILCIMSFLEGITTKMHEISINKNFYTLSKKFEYYNYNYVYEFTQNLLRTLVLVICYFFINDIKKMIYLCLFVQLIGTLFNFKIDNKKDYEVKE